MQKCQRNPTSSGLEYIYIALMKAVMSVGPTPLSSRVLSASIAGQGDVMRSWS